MNYIIENISFIQLTLEEIHKKELNMLIELDRICRKLNLRYVLVGGTLLGAIRHKGFIPWDDDIDVGMPRPDYENFLKYFTKNCNCENYSLLSTCNKVNTQMPFTKMCDQNIKIDSDLIINTSNLAIDIFPIDGLPSNRKERIKVLRRANKLRGIIIHSKSDLSNLKKFKGIKKFFVKIFHIYAKMYGKKRATQELIALCKTHDFENNDMCGIIAWATYSTGEDYPKNGFDQLIEIEFEGHSFLSISCWDQYLKGIYGDYMQLPPEDKRKTHEMSAYIRR